MNVQTAWPASDLEYLGACPVCGSGMRTLLYADLEDWVHRAAAGTWQMHRCGACRAAYLDPRPSRASIGRAYARYQTHGAIDDPFATPRTLFGRLRRDARNGYLNAAYGYALTPASAIGGWVVRLVPSLRGAVDTWVGKLPAPRPGGRLLDVGCGNGAWLDQMRRLGWEVQGVEPDEKAAAIGRASRIPIAVATADALPAFDAPFDAVSLSHVIEHLHDPIAVLRSLRAHIKPGGILRIATPNMGGFGHARYGPHWRGLEAPRHLVLFTGDTLRTCLEQAGYAIGRPERTRWWASEHFLASESVQREAGVRVTPTGAGYRFAADLIGTVYPERSEEIVYLARAR